MPWKPRTHTPHPRAREAKRRSEHQMTTTQRGYGWDWQQLVQRLRRERPICEWEDRNHQGITRASKEGHHIIKLRIRPDLRLDESNIAMICKECHDAATAKGE